MMLSRAMAVAANGMDLRDERLRAIAQALATDQRGPGRRSRLGDPPGHPDRTAHARYRHESLLAVQASRRVLIRNIDMLT